MPPVSNEFTHGHFADSAGLIDRWRRQRLALRKRLLQLIGSQLTSATLEERQNCLENLCGELIDYVSVGHFEIYSSLMRRHANSSQELRTLTTYLYRCIGSSTDLVLQFNTSCERSSAFVGSRQMSDALARLTRSLMVRFALEEQLLELTTEYAL